MKTKILLVLGAIFFTLSCEKEGNSYIDPLKEVSACGYNDPLNQLEWLNELANKSLDDKTGNYIGSIWLITYENSDIIVTDMALGSGGIAFYLFDCNGVQSSDLEDLSLDELNSYLTDSNKIFSTSN
ncbi:hypothetical protein [Sunxiuqinia sp. sy24]|uniref:hypothetical protein n=1 Tax=Sunxiuqinia sp. sy24 TaxID=3461495 RepID=UPI0040467B35